MAKIIAKTCSSADNLIGVKNGREACALVRNVCRRRCITLRLRAVGLSRWLPGCLPG